MDLGQFAGSPYLILTAYLPTVLQAPIKLMLQVNPTLVLAWEKEQH